MKLYLLLFTISIFAISCGNNTPKETEPITEQENQTQEIEVEEEVVSEPVVEKSPYLGEWEFYDSKLKVNMVVKINEDQTYNMNMGVTKVNGTWEKTGDKELTFKNKPTSNGQVWKVTKIEDNDFWAIWNTNSKNPQEIKFTRVKE